MLLKSPASHGNVGAGRPWRRSRDSARYALCEARGQIQSPQRGIVPSELLEITACCASNGWTTYLSGALDPRIDVAVPVAGGSPSSQRLLDVIEAWELGDYVQFFPQLYDVVGHENLIAAAGTRALFVAYSPRDPCCYRLGPDDPFFAWLAAAGESTGKPIVAAVDPAQRRHGLSAGQLEELDRFLAVRAPVP